ncbi:hypothetical protein Dimus_035302 [Dionaea muscipula]
MAEKPLSSSATPTPESEASETIGGSTSNAKRKAPDSESSTKKPKPYAADEKGGGEEVVEQSRAVEDELPEKNVGSGDPNGCHDSRGSTDFTIEAGAADDKGSRHTMEDAWVVLPDASLGCPGKLRCAHFAIYDGHGGRLAADYAKKHLHPNVLSAGLPRELVCFAWSYLQRDMCSR